MAITKTEVKSFHSDFSKTVADLETKYGVKISLGNITYGDFEFAARMTVNKLNKDSVIPHKLVNTERVQYSNTVAKMYGIKFNGNMIGSFWSYRDMILLIEDYNTRAKRMPWKVKVLKPNNTFSYMKVTSGFFNGVTQLSSDDVDLKRKFDLI